MAFVPRDELSMPEFRGLPSVHMVDLEALLAGGAAGDFGRNRCDVDSLCDEKVIYPHFSAVTLKGPLGIVQRAHV